MERIIVSIQERLKNKVLELQTIDEDFGQLETDEDTYPVLFPCALISVESVLWQTLPKNVQMGKALVRITVTVDSYDDTHQGSGTNQKMIDNYKIVRNVHTAIQNFSGKIIPVLDDDGEAIEGKFIDDNFKNLNRVSESTKIIDLGIKSHSKIYEVTVYDSDAIVNLQTIERPKINIATS